MVGEAEMLRVEHLRVDEGEGSGLTHDRLNRTVWAAFVDELLPLLGSCKLPIHPRLLGCKHPQRFGFGHAASIAVTPSSLARWLMASSSTSTCSSWRVVSSWTTCWTLGSFSSHTPFS